MVTARIATNFQFQTNVNRMQDLNASLNKSSYQISTGLEAQDYEDIATEVNELLNLQDQRILNQQYMSNIETAQSRLSATENAIQGMNDIILDAANVWTLGRSENTAETRANLAPTAEGLTEAFYTLFNTQFDGRYIFSGAAANQPPITASPTANTFPGNPAPTTYYNGDSQKLQVITAPSSSEDYGITGDNQAFADMKAGLEALWFGLENNSESDIDGAIDLLTQAQSGLSDILGEIGGQKSALEIVNDRHTNTNNFLTTRVDEIEKVDVAEAMTRFNQELASLEASMTVITQLNALSLVDFLR